MELETLQMIAPNAPTELLNNVLYGLLDSPPPERLITISESLFSAAEHIRQTADQRAGELRELAMVIGAGARDAIQPPRRPLTLIDELRLAIVRLLDDVPGKTWRGDSKHSQAWHRALEVTERANAELGPLRGW